MYKPKLNEVLKHKKAKSSFDSIAPQTQFEPIIIKKRSTSSKIILCSGKISYDLELDLSYNLEPYSKRKGSKIILLSLWKNFYRSLFSS